MDKKIRIKFQGRDVEATPIEVNQSTELWNTYMLDDGSMLRLKVIVTNVNRIDNMYDAEGSPVYAIKSTNIAKVDAPDILKKKQ